MGLLLTVEDEHMQGKQEMPCTSSNNNHHGRLFVRMCHFWQP
jgi:hypothetical protein